MGMCIHYRTFPNSNVDNNNNSSNNNNNNDKREYKSMTIQQVIEELKNIKEQATNDDEIGKNSILEAITDIIHDAGGDGLDFDMDFDDDHFSSFEETDFSSLADMD